MPRPRIALTACSRLPDYEDALRAAGAEPVVVRADDSRIEDVVAAFPGVVLSGGGDIDPVLYAVSPHALFDPAEPGRDTFELGLARLLRTADRPLLAICRGIQVLNVARGGDLIQDIPSERPSPITHRLRTPADAVAHVVQVEPDSRLADLMHDHLSPAGTMGVNSRHHQAINRLGDGLRVVARAGDGIVEAVEDPATRFCLGVQWHPENFWRSGVFQRLFEGFVEACR